MKVKQANVIYGDDVSFSIENITYKGKYSFDNDHNTQYIDIEKIKMPKDSKSIKLPEKSDNGVPIRIFASKILSMYLELEEIILSEKFLPILERMVAGRPHKKCLDLKQCKIIILGDNKKVIQKGEYSYMQKQYDPEYRKFHYFHDEITGDKICYELHWTKAHGDSIELFSHEVGNNVNGYYEYPPKIPESFDNICSEHGSNISDLEDPYFIEYPNNDVKIFKISGDLRKYNYRFDEILLSQFENLNTIIMDNSNYEFILKIIHMASESIGYPYINRRNLTIRLNGCEHYVHVGTVIPVLEGKIKIIFVDSDNITTDVIDFNFDLTEE